MDFKIESNHPVFQLMTRNDLTLFRREDFQAFMDQIVADAPPDQQLLNPQKM